MMKKYFIDKIDWEFYLERNMPLFLAAGFIKIYGPLLKKFTGFGFFNRLFIYKKDRYIFYQSSREVIMGHTHYLKMAEKNPKKLLGLAAKAKTLNLEADILLNKFKGEINFKNARENYNKILKKCEEIILFGTVMPYKILAAFDYEIERGKDIKKFGKIIKVFEKLRGETRYPQIVSVIFKSLWKTAAYFSGVNDYSLFSFFTPQEIGKLLKNPNNYKLKQKLTEIKKRKKLCLFYGDPKKDLIVFEYRREFINKIDKTNIIKGIKKIKGKTAFKGYAKGRVRVINKAEDMRNFRKGEIIVSINTSPSLLPAILKCGGIITNEGGMMCHAAIISRELKKPCVIGTKIATQVLKDDDLIELNADKGIVKIIRN